MKSYQQETFDRRVPEGKMGKPSMRRAKGKRRRKGNVWTQARFARKSLKSEAGKFSFFFF